MGERRRRVQLSVDAVSDPQFQRAVTELTARIARNDCADAERLAHSLTAIAPMSAVPWHLAGLVAFKRGDAAAALSRLERAAALAPSDAAIWNSLGLALSSAGKHAAAADALRTAVRLNPDLAGAAVNLGSALDALGDLDGAVEAVERAVAHAPQHADAWNNLGNLYKEQGRLSESMRAYEQALALNALHREAFSNRLAALKLATDCDARALLAAHRTFAARFEGPRIAGYDPETRDDRADRRLRVGYLSPDCHGALPAFIRPVLRAHDPASFEIYCYYNNRQPPEMDATIAANVTPRITAGMTDAQVEAQIRADGIDILVDIAGHTGHNRLAVLMARPAPIQVTWLDYLATTGLDTVDYRVTDGRSDPPGWADASHAEALIRLPDTQWCYEPAADAPAVGPLPALREGCVTFGSFNHCSKLTDTTLAIWARLLTALPSARLLVVGMPEGVAQQRVRDALPSGSQERLAFLPRLRPAEYRAAYARVDIALDPMPFSGATTTLDALWQGVPVITLPGTTSASRSSSSILAAAGLDGFVASDADDYLAIAVRWSSRLHELAELRSTLRDALRRSALTDALCFTRHLEHAFRRAWQARCEATPSPFARRLPSDDVCATSIRPSKWRRADLAYREARALLDSGRLDEAIPSLQRLLAVHQNWQRVHADLCAAALAWARAHPISGDASPRLPADTPFVSIVMCSIDEDKLERATSSYRSRFASIPHEIVAIRDARSLSEGFNRGAAQARGEILVFSHDDVELVTPDFAPRLIGHLRDFDAIGVAGTSRLVSANWGHAGQPYLHGHVIHRPAGESGYILMAAGCNDRVMTAIEAVDGVFIAVRRAAWDAVRYDEANFDGFHLYDIDFSHRLTRAGFRIAVPLDLSLIHQSTGSYGKAWQRYATRFEAMHGPTLAPRPDVVPGSIHCRVQTLEQVRLLLAGLTHFRYGAIAAPVA